MKNRVFLFGILIFASCLSTPKATIVSASETDFNALNVKIQALLAAKKMDSSTSVEKISDPELKASLEKINIGSLRVVNKTSYGFGDSVIIYAQQNKYLSVRLYRWEKWTYIVYDLSVNQRNISAKKIKERVYIDTWKEPGSR